MDVEEPVLGLPTAEAEAARRRGEANTAVSGTSRTYATIRRTHVLFLCPPTRFSAAWTRPTGDREPTVLVVAFGVVLFVPALSDYFGLTGPAAPVFTTVLPALALWFGTLTAAYRFRLLDRVLGLDALP